MFISKWTTSTLLMAFVVLSCETNEIEEQSDTCVWVEVNLHQSHNSSETSCEAPKQPLNGGYMSDTDIDNTGDTIMYYCHRGYRLVGQVNRTCNGTSKQWEPEEPYCEPEYISPLMQRLNSIEDQMRRLDGIDAELRVIKQSIENNTLQIGYNISVMDNRTSTIDHKITAMDNRGSAMENNVSAICNMSKMALTIVQVSSERLGVCTDVTKAIDEDTLTKCMTMQLGVRDGHSVSVYTWVIEDYKNKVPQSGIAMDYSPPFYHTVPGYKFRLKGFIYSSSVINLRLQLLPGEYDDQLKWPFSQTYDVTVLTNNGTEVLLYWFSSNQSTCEMGRPTSSTEFQCFNIASYWDAVNNKKHILNDGSAVVKLYLYN